MSSLSNIALPKPKDWQDFERKTRELFACVLADPNTQMNGRTGQSQHGVDISGYRNEDRQRLVGVQCKRSDDAITVAELEAELEKAKGFQPPIKEFFLVTTAPRDARIQQRARELTESLSQSERPISVTVWGWQDVEEQAAKYVDARHAFDPTFNPYAERARQEILAKLDEIAGGKGVPAAPLRAILENLGEVGVPDYEIVPRFRAKADELLGLRERFALSSNDRPDVVIFRKDALALIDRGELDQARAVLRRGRKSSHAALRERASRNDAALLADEAQIDHLQLAYSEAAAKYAEAAVLVAPFDHYSEWGFLLRQADALVDQGDEFGDSEALAKAIEIYRRATDLVPRADSPADWATTQNNLGNALEILGEREMDTARLQQAVAAYNEALEEFTREHVPLRWAGTQNNLGNALRALGELESSTARLRKAVAAYQEALKELTRENAPLVWAGAHLNLSNVFSTISERETGTSLLKKAVVSCRKALKVFTRGGAALKWASAQHNLGIALQMLGARERNTARLKRAVAAYHKALTVRTRESVRIDWAMTQNNLGNAHLAIGQLDETGVAEFERAVAAYDEALTVYTRECVPLLWAQAQNNLGEASLAWGERENGTIRFERAVAAYDEALKVYIDIPTLQWAKIEGKEGIALMFLAERLGDLNMAQTAVSQISLAFAALREAYEMTEAAYYEARFGKAVALLKRLTHL